MNALTVLVVCVVTVTADDVPWADTRRLLLRILAHGGDPATLRLFAAPVNDSWSQRYSALSSGGLSSGGLSSGGLSSGGLSAAQLQALARLNLSSGGLLAAQPPREGDLHFNDAVQRQGVDLKVNLNEAQHKTLQRHGVDLTQSAVHVQHNTLERQGVDLDADEAQNDALALQGQGFNVNVNDAQHETLQRNKIDLTQAAAHIQDNTLERQGVDLNVNVNEAQHDAIQRQGMDNVNVNDAHYNALQRQGIDLTQGVAHAQHNTLQRQGIDLAQGVAHAQHNTLQRQGIDLAQGVAHAQHNTIQRQGIDVNFNVNDAQHNTLERQGTDMSIDDAKDSAWSAVTSLSALDGGATLEELSTALAALGGGDPQPLRRVLALLQGAGAAPRYRGRLSHYLRAVRAWLHPAAPPLSAPELAAAARDVSRQLRALSSPPDRHALLALTLRRLRARPELCQQEARQQLSAAATDALLKYQKSLARCEHPLPPTPNNDSVSPAPDVSPLQ